MTHQYDKKATTNSIQDFNTSEKNEQLTQKKPVIFDIYDAYGSYHTSSLNKCQILDPHPRAYAYANAKRLLNFK